MKRWLAVFAFAVLAGLSPIRPADAGVERVVSPGGIEAWLIEDHSNPLISVALAFRGGAALDPAGKGGLSNLVSGLLDEGAGNLDSAAFQKKLADLSIDFDFESYADDFEGSLRTLTIHRDDAFNLLHLALTRPRFDAEPVARVRGQVLAVLADESGDPDYLASQAWMRLALGDHPYAQPVEGTPASVAAVTAADLHQFVAQRFARDNLLIAVVGDITPADLAPLLDRTFGDLPAKAATATVLDTAPPTAGGIAVINRDLDQSLVYFGEAGLKRDDPDFYAAALIDNIMGGSALDSRLGRALRVRRGLVYSVSTSLLTYDHSGLLFGSLGTKNASVGEAIAILNAEWRRLGEQGLTAKELADAKSFIIGNYPLNFTSSRSAAGSLLALRLDGLPIDYVDRRVDLFGRVTLADAARVARRLYRADSLRFLVVGQPQGIAPDLKAPAGE